MTLVTRRSALKLGLAGGALLATSPMAMAQLRIVVEGANFQPLPIAIPDFASSDPTFGREIADIVRNNLRRSGLFLPLDPASLPVQVGDVNGTPDFNIWRTANVDALVMGSVERGGQISSSVRVWDTRQAAQVVGKSYNTDPNSARRVGHIVSDAIYEQLAGGSGYFDTRVIYVAESGPKANRTRRLAIMDQDGANMQYLTDGSSMALTPRFAPNGDLVTYMNFADGNPQVYLLQLSSGQQQRLANVGAMTFAPRFSPDGGTVVFSVEQSGATNIYSVGTGGGAPSQLTSGSAIDTGPSFSPDGSRIVFESDRGGSPQIYMMGAGGGNAQRVSFGQGSYSTPVWSPKGDLIAYTRQSGGQFHIGIMAPDGSGERLLYSSFHAEGPTWAPNGRVIMFFQDPGGNDGPRLMSVDIWGRNPQTISTDTYASDPSWSGLRA
ncbi:Tol-Pal system beta propeller repeat protein TolB [Devosia sp. BK]|uniref:Tol-Pal system beta propeller repeat protein TolB n=1 Tax=unclassified Devosia TaxID=196773 RepID=UPI000713F843|nr:MULTISPECIES: Tol-Pal system beta propeller repeat protein TolB [unclassified Devosia]KQN77335.1 translocation protein TolB [Devosia sp. Leaf64]MDV3252970.1 Tol-Pal system beta propeller repeat protein TolB [Devosia sp. BK]